MILHSLALTNFRQFRGEHKIVFAEGAGGTGPNVTVIFGENGRGKTGVFRGLMFALYGERRLTQDGDVPDAELQLVNTAALKASGGKPVRTVVELDFTHRGNRYLLRRAIKGVRDADRVLEELDEVYLQRTDPHGNTKVVDVADVDRAVQTVLDPRVREYFLFDGEKIERLTRASIEQRHEISRGIRNLLSVDALDGAIKASAKLVRSIDGQLATQSTGELARCLKRLRGNEDAQEKARGDLETLAEETSRARTEKTKVDQELDKIGGIRHLLETRHQKELDLAGFRQQSSDLLAGMKQYVVRAAGLLVAPCVAGAFAHIDKQKQRGEIPSEIRRDLIERLLEEHRCICGRELREGTKPHAAILEWQARTSEVSLQDAALNLWRHLSEVHHRAADDATQIEKCLLQYGLLRNRIETLQRELEDIGAQISGSERQDAPRLEAHRERIEEKLRNLEAQSLNQQQTLTELLTQNEQLKAQLEEERRKSARSDELSRRAFLIRETRDALQETFASFTQEVREHLGQLATGLFRELLDAESRANLRTIIVNEDYSLQVLDRWSQPFLANISAGQRQVMSIAFIAALAKAAAHDTRLEMPLFMDTPFGRLSAEHRRNLITEIPDFAGQWVLLATDTEFRRQEAQWLKATGRWGRFYRLRPAREGATKIEEMNIEAVPALLRDEADTP